MKKQEFLKEYASPFMVSVLSSILCLFIFLVFRFKPVTELILFQKASNTFAGLPVIYHFFFISRYWDILFVFLFTLLLTAIIQYIKDSQDDFTSGLSIGLILTVFVSLIFVFAISPVIAGAIILVLTLLMAMGSNFEVIHGFVITSSIIFGIAISLVSSFAFGFIVMLAFFVISIVIIELILIFKILLKKDF